MKNFRTILVISLLAFCSCKKERPGSSPNPVTEQPPVTEPFPQPTIWLMKVVLEGLSQPLEMFEYNKSGQLIKRSEFLHNSMPVTFTYADNKPVRMDMTDQNTGRILYTYQQLYNGDKLDKIKMFYKGADPDEQKALAIWKCSYTDGLLTMATGYGADETEASSYSRTVHTYYPNGDLKTTSIEERAGAGQYILSSEITYAYDDKVNPMRTYARYLTGYSPYVYAAKHNIIKETWTEGANRKTTQVISRAYTYHSDGYPIRAVTSYHYPEDPADNYTEKTDYIYSVKK